MKKQLVLALLVSAVAVSAAHAEKSTFETAKEIAGNIVSHPATRISLGTAITVATVFNIVVNKSALKGQYTSSFWSVDGKTSFAKMTNSGRATAVARRVLGIFGRQLPLAAALSTGLYLIGSGINDAVTRTENKKA